MRFEPSWSFIFSAKEKLHEKIIRTREKNNIDLKQLRSMFIPISEYQEKYNKQELNKKLHPINRRFISAGVPSKGKPEYHPLEYDSSAGIVPRFKGESTARAAFRAQPPISRLPSFKPPQETKEPILLGPEMMEVESYSTSVHCPMPLELARQTAPVIPLWIREKLKPIEYKTRYDLTSSYQADFCGHQTKSRNVCLMKSNKGDNWTEDDCDNTKEDKIKEMQRTANQEISLWNFVNSLIYRTTNESTYLPPSVFGEPMCHRTKYHPDE